MGCTRYYGSWSKPRFAGFGEGEVIPSKEETSEPRIASGKIDPHGQLVAIGKMRTVDAVGPDFVGKFVLVDL